MSESMGTFVSSMRRGPLIFFGIALLSLHATCYIGAFFFAPELFVTERFREEEGSFSLSKAEGDYSAWNRRLMGSLDFYSTESPSKLNLSGVLRSGKDQYEMEDDERLLFCQSRPDNVSFCSLEPLFDIILTQDVNETYRISLELDQSHHNYTMRTRTEEPRYHKTLFFFQCLFTPFLLPALIHFIARIHVNDLYISIPDRCLITVACSLFFKNIPVRVLFSEKYMVLYEELSRGFLISSLFLFWLIFAGDKASAKESWERNTRYYWKSIVSILFFSILFTLDLCYSRLPSLKSPFKNHWNSSSTARIITLAFTFTSAGILLLGIMSYLSIVTFRVLLSRHMRKRISRRLGWASLYCYLSSIVTAGDFLLRQALCFMDTSSYLRSFSSVLLLGAEGYWNIHVIALLILLSRDSETGGNNVMPIRYGKRNDIERKEFDEVIGLTSYNSLLDEPTR